MFIFVAITTEKGLLCIRLDFGATVAAGSLPPLQVMELRVL
jgi:hypothetical protein